MIQILRTFTTSTLSIYLFAILSVYTLYAILYERLVMHPYYNGLTGETQYQLTPAVLLLWEQSFSWAFIELYSEFKLSKNELKQQKNKIPWITSGLFGIPKLISIALFIQGIYQTNFRFAFMVRTGLFIASSVFSTIHLKITKKTFDNQKKIIQILFSALVLGGTILFWIYDPEICFYVPIEPRVKAAIMIIVSVLIDGILSLVRSIHINKEGINPIRMQRDSSTWIAVLSYFYLISKGNFTDDFKFAVRHLSYLSQVLAVGFLYFLTQLIEFKASQLISNVSGYLHSSGMFLILIVSYSFSVHQLYLYQIVGILMVLTGIIGGLFALSEKQRIQPSGHEKIFKPYEKICDLEIQQEE